MITLDAFLVFLGAASLPVIYLFICSRWIEPAQREAGGPQVKKEKTKAVVKHELTQQAI